MCEPWPFLNQTHNTSDGDGKKSWVIWLLDFEDEVFATRRTVCIVFDCFKNGHEKPQTGKKNGENLMKITALAVLKTDSINLKRWREEKLNDFFFIPRFLDIFMTKVGKKLCVDRRCTIKNRYAPFRFNSRSTRNIWER